MSELFPMPAVHIIPAWVDEMAGKFMAIRPPGGFRAGISDWPWQFQHFSEKGHGKSPQRHYGTMSIDDLKRIPVGLLFADNAALFSWHTWPLMVFWPEVIEAWGFEFAGLAWEWLKYNPATGKYAFGGGYGTRKNVEPCLLLTRGNPQLRQPIESSMLGDAVVPEGVRSVRDFIEAMPMDAIRAPRRRHSEKPDEQYERVETMFDGPYVEMFSRRDRDRWVSFGNEAGKHNDAN